MFVTQHLAACPTHFWTALRVVFTFFFEFLEHPVFSFRSSLDCVLLVASRHLGVIIATSEAGHAMAPEAGGDFMICRLCARTFVSDLSLV